MRTILIRMILSYLETMTEEKLKQIYSVIKVIKKKTN